MDIIQPMGSLKPKCVLKEYLKYKIGLLGLFGALILMSKDELVVGSEYCQDTRLDWAWLRIYLGIDEGYEGWIGLHSCLCDSFGAKGRRSLTTSWFDSTQQGKQSFFYKPEGVHHDHSYEQGGLKYGLFIPKTCTSCKTKDHLKIEG